MTRLFSNCGRREDHVATLGTILVGVVLGTGGCVSSQNARTSIGPAEGAKSVALPAIHPLPSLRAEADGYADGPSLAVDGSGMDRSHWGVVTIDAPFDGVGGNPRYTREYRYTDQTARQRGDYPTPLSALELTGQTEQAQRDEAIINPLMYLTQATLLIPRMLMHAPWKEVHHEPGPYWRVTPTQSGDQSAR
jgi:hypothetical protein